MYIAIKLLLSTIVWIGQKSYSFQKIHFNNNQPCNRLYKGIMHCNWLGCNDAVPWLNKAKTIIIEYFRLYG